MPLMEVKVLPLGTRTASVSEIIAHVVRCVVKSGFRYELTAMGTIVEGETVRGLLELAAEMHEAAFSQGVARVVTFIEIDERTDKPLTIDGKKQAVYDRL